MTSNSISLPVSVPCPHCGKKLKVQQKELLGKKVKCPKCQQPFRLPVLEPPRPAQKKSAQEEEVQFELVTNDDPPVGTSAKWIPDPEFSSSSKEPAATPIGSSGKEAPVAPGPAATAPSPGPIVITPVDEFESGVRTRFRKRRKQQLAPMLIFGLCLLAGIGTLAFFVLKQSSEPAPRLEPLAANKSEKSSSIPELNAPYSKALLENREQIVEQFQPTKGAPIELLMMPGGVNFVIHFRPALLWSDEYDYQVLKASLTDQLTGSAAQPGWIEATLMQVCRRRPEQIEEVVIGFIIGARGTEPDVCAVVHLKQAAKLSDLIDEFDGNYLFDITEKPNLRLKVNDQFGYLIRDENTFAIVPAHLAAELEYSIDRPNMEISEGMEFLLKKTDRQRLFTAVGNLGDLRRHVDTMFPESSRQAFGELFRWFGDDVETAGWSIHCEPYLHSELMLRTKNTASSTQVKTQLEAQLGQLSQTMWKDVCLKMSPQEVGFRRLIGRLPAMLEAFQRSTVISTSAQFLTLTTVLPAKAAPNLALAALLTADEANRTDFTQDVVVVSNEKKLPETVAERLNLPVDAEFNRRPLEQALAYLCGEIEVKLNVDGDALKDAGYTRNMPQTFNLGVVPVKRALAEIVNNYQEPGKLMVISIDEQNKTLHLTTKKFAMRKGMEIFEFAAN